MVNNQRGYNGCIPSAYCFSKDNNSVQACRGTTSKTSIRKMSASEQSSTTTAPNEQESPSETEEPTLEAPSPAEDIKHVATPPPTPLPWGKLLIVFSIYLCDSLSFTSLFPYISFMVADFGITDDPKQYGYYVGIITSCYFLSQLFSSFMWGFISDKIGRRPVLLWGSFFGACVGLCFGFSRYLWWACLARFMFGFLNGYVLNIL